MKNAKLKHLEMFHPYGIWHEHSIANHQSFDTGILAHALMRSTAELYALINAVIFEPHPSNRMSL